jgi:oligoribonuclease
MSDKRERLVWVDLEMTGLDPSVATIVEIATLVTDGALEILAEGPELVIHASDDDLAKMPPVVVEMHTRSGLLDKIRASAITLAEAERQTVEFLRAHVEKGTAPLAGNSVWKDKQFLEKYMPAVMGELHYRIVDVSTVKELTRRWYPGVAAPRKNELHRAMDDIRESIAELKFYRANVFR